jgi:hypothetical protein
LITHLLRVVFPDRVLSEYSTSYPYTPEIVNSLLITFRVREVER